MSETITILPQGKTKVLVKEQVKLSTLKIGELYWIPIATNAYKLAKYKGEFNGYHRFGNKEFFKDLTAIYVPILEK